MVTEYRCADEECRATLYDIGPATKCPKCQKSTFISIGEIKSEETIQGTQEIKLIRMRFDFTTDAKNQKVFTRIMEIINQLESLSINQSTLMMLGQEKDEPKKEEKSIKWQC